MYGKNKLRSRQKILLVLNKITVACYMQLQYCAKVMQTYFAEIHGFSWLFDEKISNFRWKRIFNEKSRQFVIPIVFKWEFSNDNSFGMKIYFKFSSENLQCSIMT